MKNMIKNLEKQFSEVAGFIQKTKNETLKIVNKTLIDLYWNVGKYISQKIENSDWGDAVVTELANYLNQKHPDLRGFNGRGLWRMKQFYETYKDNEKLTPLVTQISWTNNLLLLSKTKTLEEKEFYIRLSTFSYFGG